jgi:hypothetical protein
MTQTAMKATPAGFSAAGLRSSLTETTFARLEAAMGARQARPLAESVLAQLGLHSLVTSQDLCDFANGLMQQRGAAEFVGRSLKVTALLRGAVDRPIPPRSDSPAR